MRTTPFATIVIPTFNQDSYLPQALESLLAQTDPDWEAIIVNDGSTDDTRRIADDYASRDARFRCIHKSNGGVASALNTGLEHARGDWIHWLSSDDLFESHKLATNRRWIERYPETGFFFSYFTLLRESSGVRERRELWGPLPDPEHQLLTLFFRNYVSGISICVRRTAWMSVGQFDTSLRYAQDYDLWLRLLQQYQGRFIPDWTVVSRNHSEQGSETFPDACYFDTAKAAIRFINKHAFPELVPWADLTDAARASKAITCALDAACDRTSFVYCLGPNPALVLRVLEWVFSDSCSFPSLRAQVEHRILEMSFVDGDDDWSWMWRQMAVTIQGGNRRFRYCPTDASHLALTEWRSKQLDGDAKQGSLRDYLARFENIDVEKTLPEAGDKARVAFLIESGAGGKKDIILAASRLAKRGFRPVVLLEDLATQLPAWDWVDNVPMISVSAFDKEILPWLGDIELAVTSSDRTNVWLGSLSRLPLQGGVSSAVIEDAVVEKLVHPANGALRPVVFLERLQWGGGAERVVYDLARHLDRGRYQPFVFTMFEEHTVGPQWPSHIKLRNIRAGEQPTPVVATPLRSRSPIRVLRSAYHRLLPESRREKIGVGRLIHGLRRRSSIKSRRAGLANPMDTTSHHIDEPRDDATMRSASFDFVASMVHHNPSATALAKAIAGTGSDALVVSVMEEAAVAAWLAQAASPFPYIASLHTVESACLPDIYPGAGRLRAEKWLFSAACNGSSVVTMPTDGCRIDLAVDFAVSPSKIRKIPNPVDCSKVRWLSFQQNLAVEEWKAANPTFRLVHVGRLDPQKNHSFLLSVCRQLKSRGRAFSLAIVGGGSAQRDIENIVHEYGLENEVILVGEQGNPFPWIAAADVLLLTSRFEAFALVLLEAMVCETPVVSVDCPVGPAEVLNNGEFGLLVSPNDPVTMADAVERLMDDPELALRLKKSGHERAISFDVKNILPLWEALIDETPAILEAQIDDKQSCE